MCSSWYSEAFFSLTCVHIKFFCYPPFFFFVHFLLLLVVGFAANEPKENKKNKKTKNKKQQHSGGCTAVTTLLQQFLKQKKKSEPPFFIYRVHIFISAYPCLWAIWLCRCDHIVPCIQESVHTLLPTLTTLFGVEMICVEKGGKKKKDVQLCCVLFPTTPLSHMMFIAQKTRVSDARVKPTFAVDRYGAFDAQHSDALWIAAFRVNQDPHINVTQPWFKKGCCLLAFTPPPHPRERQHRNLSREEKPRSTSFVHVFFLSTGVNGLGQIHAVLSSPFLT